MPNVIKANSVIIKDESIKVIDSNQKDEFQPMSFKEAVEIDSENASEEDIQNSKELFQMNHSDNTSDKIENMQSYVANMIEDAKRDAETIRLDAMVKAKQEIQEEKQKAISEGYAQGLTQANDEIEQKRQQLNALEDSMNQEFNQKMKEMQQSISSILIALVQKITGVILEERSIITYLVSEAMKGQPECNEFRIIVSKADYPEVEAHMDQLKEIVRSTAVITVVENPEFTKDQCKIETDKNIIDCSIETKVSNLVMALKLL